MSGFRVKQPGLLSLLHDRGRYGAHDLGLTTGGPLDFVAFDWANRLLGNHPNATCIEVSFGGLTLEADCTTGFAITGADAPCKLNDDVIEQWRSLVIKPGDRLEIGFATSGTRVYLAVSGGFDIAPSFGSTSTVLREKIGGLNGDKLQAEDHLPCAGLHSVNSSLGALTACNSTAHDGAEKRISIAGPGTSAGGSRSTNGTANQSAATGIAKAACDVETSPGYLHAGTSFIVSRPCVSRRCRV